MYVRVNTAGHFDQDGISLHFLFLYVRLAKANMSVGTDQYLLYVSVFKCQQAHCIQQ